MDLECLNRIFSCREKFKLHLLHQYIKVQLVDKYIIFYTFRNIQKLSELPPIYLLRVYVRVSAGWGPPRSYRIKLQVVNKYIILVHQYIKLQSVNKYTILVDNCIILLHQCIELQSVIKYIILVHQYIKLQLVDFKTICN